MVSNTSFSEDTVARLCVEYWKLLRAANKAVRALSDTGEASARRLEGQIRFSERQLQVIANDLGLKLIEFEGEPFRDGIAASSDNASDFDENDRLVVSRTIEPAVVKDMRVLSYGRVLVALAPQDKGKDDAPRD